MMHYLKFPTSCFCFINKYRHHPYWDFYCIVFWKKIELNFIAFCIPTQLIVTTLSTTKLSIGVGLLTSSLFQPMTLRTISSSCYSSMIWSLAFSPHHQVSQCRVLEIGSVAHFSSSGGNLSEPAVRPFFSRAITSRTSCRLRASEHTSAVSLVETASWLKSGQAVADGWLNIVV